MAFLWHFGLHCGGRSANATLKLDMCDFIVFAMKTSLSFTRISVEASTPCLHESLRGCKKEVMLSLHSQSRTHKAMHGCLHWGWVHFPSIDSGRMMRSSNSQFLHLPCISKTEHYSILVHACMCMVVRAWPYVRGHTCKKKKKKLSNRVPETTTTQAVPSLLLSRDNHTSTHRVN